MRLAEQSRSTQAAPRALNIDPKRLDQWQKLPKRRWRPQWRRRWNPATAAELRQLRALARRQAQELDILKKPLPSSRIPRPHEYAAIP